MDNTELSNTLFYIKNGGRIKGEGKTSKTSKNTSQRRKTQGPGKGLEEAKNRSAPHQESGCGGTSNQGVLNHRRDHQNHQSQQGLG